MHAALWLIIIIFIANKKISRRLSEREFATGGLLVGKWGAGEGYFRYLLVWVVYLLVSGGAGEGYFRYLLVWVVTCW